MAIYIEDHLPVVKYEGLNTAKNTSLGGTLAVAGATTLTGTVTPTAGVAAAGGFSTSPRLVSAGRAATVSTDGTDATPVTTETYIGEVFVPANMTVTGVAIFNGSVATNGNAMVGLANSSGVVVAQSVSTALSGTDAYQRIAFTATYAAVGPATYYILTQYSSGSDRYNAWAVGNFGASKKTSETFGTFTTVTPPTTFTTNLATIASLY